MTRDRRPKPREREAGVILLNVLLIVAIASGVVALMIASQSVSLVAARRASAASQADALVRAGEASALAALERDRVEAPEVDHAAEPWAAVAQERVVLGDGTFELAVQDLQGRFNLTRMGGASADGTATRASVADAALFARLLDELELSPEILDRVQDGVARAGVLRDVADLKAFGVDAAELAYLALHVAVLPERADINLNAASLPVLAAVLSNAYAARTLAARRERQGFLTPDDLRGVGVLMPRGTGWTSDVFEARITVETDGVGQAAISRIERGEVPEGDGTRIEARVVSRRYVRPVAPDGTSVATADGADGAGVDRARADASPSSALAIVPR